MAEDKQQVTTVEDAQPDFEAAPAIVTTSALAARYEHHQHSLTRWESIKESKLAIAWCMYMFFLCIAWGYDGLAGGIVLSIAKFREDFGEQYQGAYVIPAKWQLAWIGASTIGLLGGGFVAGQMINRWGRQLPLLVAFILSVSGVFAQFFATTPAEFFAGKLLTGLPLGFFTTAAPPYASEMAPLSIRGSISAGMNFAIVLGQLIGYGVMRETNNNYTDSMSYRVMFATQWGFAAVGLAVLPFFPESPYFLLSKGRADKALKNLKKLYKPEHDFEGHMANIHEALAKQNADSEAQGGMLECLNAANWRRTLCGTSMFFIQNTSGVAWVVGYMSYYFQLAGMSPSKSFDATVGIAGVMVIGNMFGWVAVDWLGRRSTVLYGSATLTACLFLIGILSVIKANGALWGQLAFMGIWGFVYQSTLGAAAWPIAAENATSRLRAPTQALCTMMNGLSGSIWSFALPYAINPDEGNLGGKIGFIFGATLVAATIFIYFFIPETKGRTYVEIDELWARKIAPRKFKDAHLVVIPDVDGKEVDQEAIAEKI